MEDDYPIVVEGEWSHEDSRSAKSKLHIYFQSKKKSQGGDCSVQLHDDGGIATVLFKSLDARERVLAKGDHEISIDNKRVKLSVHLPNVKEREPEVSSSQPTGATSGHHIPDEGLEEDMSGGQTMAVVLENITDKINRDMLDIMVESISSLTEDDYSVEMIFESEVAVVTFTKSSDVTKFLSKSKTNKKFQQYDITARALERSSSVWVENLPLSASGELLDLYFEKCGAPVVSVDKTQVQAALVNFRDEKVAETILSKEHTICKVPVNIYPYCKSLGTVLYGKDRPIWRLPAPFTENINTALREYLVKMDHISNIIDHMAKHFCQVNFDGVQVQLSPLPALLRQKGLSRRHIDGWRGNASDAFNNIMSNYAVFQHPVNTTVREVVERDLQLVVKDQAVMKMDTLGGILTVAGLAKDMKRLESNVGEIIQRAANEMDRKMNSTSEDMEMSPAMFFLLQQDGLENTAKRCPQLKLTYRDEIARLAFFGVPAEILTVKNWVLEKKLDMKHKVLKFENPLTEFLLSTDSVKMSQDLFTSHGITAIYKIEGESVVLSGSSERALADAEKRMSTLLSCHVVLIDDQGVLENKEWTTLKNMMEELYNSPKNRTVLIKLSPNKRDRLTISGFTEPVNEVSCSLQNFISSHTRIEEVICVKTYATLKFIKEKKSADWGKFSNDLTINFDSKRPRIILHGERVHVQPAKNWLQNLAASLHTDELTIKKAGARKYFKEQGNILISVILREPGCVVMLKEDYMEEEEEEDGAGMGGDPEQCSCEVRTPAGVVITVRMADICQISVDAVVNAANEDLRHIGGVAGALLKAAGPQLQEYSDRHTKANGPLKPGDAAITGAGLLPCKNVIHAVGPRFSAFDKHTAIRLLRGAVLESLTLASRSKCSSVALPAISSGIFGFPLKLCTETIAKAVHDFIEGQNTRVSSITEILLVDNNATTVNAFTQAVKKEFAYLNPKIMQCKPGGPSGHGYHGQGDRGSGSRGRYNNALRSRNEDIGYARDGPHSKTFMGHELTGNAPHGGGEKIAHAPSSQSGQRYGEYDRRRILETNHTQNGLKIVLINGCIQDAPTDVIVNTTSIDLNLSVGAVSSALLQAAGPNIQAAAQQAARGSHLNAGQMVITDGYNLGCQRVFHVVCPRWDEGGKAEEVLIKIIRDCLTQVEMQRFASVSFPAIGTGNLGFPRDLVSQLLLDEVEAFSRNCSPQYLKEVAVVVHPEDTQSVESFVRRFRGEPVKLHPRANKQQPQQTRPAPSQSQPSGIIPSQKQSIFGVVSTPTLGVHAVKIANLTLEVSSGDITKEKCDVIVNSSNTTFSLKAGVSKAILDAAGSAVTLECSQIVNGANFQQDTRMIFTSGGQLPAQHILHIVGQNNAASIKDAVYSALKLCEEQKFTSVSFPALGTGQGGVSPSAVADTMIDAVIDFVRKKKSQHVNFVKFLIFQAAMVPDFHQSMLRRERDGVEDDPGILGRIKAEVSNKMASLFGWRGSPESTVVEEFVMVGEEFAPAVFQLCGENLQDVNQARGIIKEMIEKEHFMAKVEDDSIASFSQEDADTLKALQKDLTVSVRLEKKGPDSFVTVEGLTRDVIQAEQRIRHMIRKVERKEAHTREAFLLSSLVEWHYQDTGNTLVPFDIYDNYTLECALMSKQDFVKIQINKDEYLVDLKSRVAKNPKNTIELKRTDLKDTSSIPLPDNWKDMTGVHVLKVRLPQGSQEYTNVEKEFKRTGLQYNVVKIERVQNSTLWRSYIIRKNFLDEKNGHKNNEKCLFHGTGTDKTEKINSHGFNRNYAGSHGAMYGNGTYFAIDPAYSANNYSPPDSRGKRNLYLARVLVGESTQGKAGMLAPPDKKPGVTADTYDSVTDRSQNPSMFVIFNDVQAYPEYLITFK